MPGGVLTVAGWSESETPSHTESRAVAADPESARRAPVAGWLDSGDNRTQMVARGHHTSFVGESCCSAAPSDGCS